MMFRWNIHFRTSESQVERDYTASLERKVDDHELEISWFKAEIRRLKVAAGEVSPSEVA